MKFPIYNRALLRGILAGAVALAGASACSRSDRAESGSDTTAAALPDTVSNGTAMPSATDTSAMSGTGATDTSAPAATPRGNSGEVSGYRGMERDTGRAAGDTTLPGERSKTETDTSVSMDSPMKEPVNEPGADTASTDIADTGSAEVAANPNDASTSDFSADVADTTSFKDTVSASADTAVAGYAEMARDTTAMPEQGDTLAQAEGDVALQATIDTAHADSGVARIRPPEDSTEFTADASTGDASVGVEEDRETVAAAKADTEGDGQAEADVRTGEVGAAAIAGNVTGPEAVAGMTRQGAECVVVDPETAQGVLLDMSNTPATLNPCGLGSMVLSRIWIRGRTLQE